MKINVYEIILKSHSEFDVGVAACIGGIKKANEK